MLFSGAKPCFSESFEWPLVPPTVRVASPSDPGAGFEANGSLCRTWGVVLVCVGLLSVRYKGILGFIMNERGPDNITAAQTPTQQRMLRLCFPREQRVQDVSVWQEAQKDAGLPEHGRFPMASA